MKDVLAYAEERMKKSVSSLDQDFNALRTGRASAALFDKIRINYYGQQTPLAQVANISIPEARLIVIQPWDKSMIGEIEKSIMSSELSLNPSNDGKVIRLNIPPLTENRRRDLVKMAKSIAEKSRVSIRNIRRDAIDSMKQLEKDKDISEDELKIGEADIQKLTDSYVKQINEILELKEQEIMEV
ncbi:MAG: ribosome recycling factor [Spirochaetia bacterium]|nr:ribosome recycling factor [Spirochaetia bacterium]MCF7940158.1 ribosome recycling factor [Spirochaetia bacterium]